MRHLVFAVLIPAIGLSLGAGCSSGKDEAASRCDGAWTSLSQFQAQAADTTAPPASGDLMNGIPESTSSWEFGKTIAAENAKRVIVNNPDCFPAGDVASAQTYLRLLDNRRK